MDKKQVALIVLDGWGYREEKENNAIALASKPFFDSLWRDYPHSLLQASEEFVGLPKGQPGNSEIGHTTIGAGQIIDTDLVRISKQVKSGDFKKNKSFEKAIDFVQENNSTLHLMGVIGYGGVHGLQEYLLELIDLIKDRKKDSSGKTFKVALHLFTDGRDSGPYESIEAIDEIEKHISDEEDIFISTISGRYYAMDRDNNFDRLEKFLKFFEEDEQIKLTEDWKLEIKKQHEEGKTDENLEPFILKKTIIDKNDGVIITNFRADRVRMLASKLLEQKEEKNLHVVTFTEYNKDFEVEVAFPKKKIESVLAEEISKAGLSQAHIAETEKFPHATYFLNGGREKPYENEEHVLLNSRKDVATHDEAPEMKAKEIADETIKRIENGVDFIFVYFANPDMVGHTANVPAIIKAVEFVDEQLKRVIKALDKNGGVALVTADHGNAELNINPDTGEKHTAHTTNPVPLILTNLGLKIKDGSLSDLAPTVLKMFSIEKPDSMTGGDLLD